MDTRAYYEPIFQEKLKSIPDWLLPDLLSLFDVFQNISSHSNRVYDFRSKLNNNDILIDEILNNSINNISSEVLTLKESATLMINE